MQNWLIGTRGIRPLDKKVLTKRRAALFPQCRAPGLLGRRMRVMAKYDPLCRFLRDSAEQHLDVSMDVIANMVEGGLPPSTIRPCPQDVVVEHLRYSPRPGNDWLAAGHVVVDVDHGQRRVRFRRGSVESLALTMVHLG
jgi:hypothetical protein